MPGFATRDDLIAEAALGKMDRWDFAKLAPGNSVTNAWYSFWKSVGSGGTGADPATTPGTAYSPDQSTAVAGAMFFPDRASDQRHLVYMQVTGINNGCLMLYDRLVGVAGITLNSTGAKTVNSTAVPRYSGTDAFDNEAWLEITTATSATAPIVNISSYTAADGSTGLAGGSVTFPNAASLAGVMVPLPLADTDAGVRSVETLNVGTAGGAGVATVVILRPIARIPILAGIPTGVSFLDDVLTLPRILDNACLALAQFGIGAVTHAVNGSFDCVYG